jgi:hypothetical protein
MLIDISTVNVLLGCLIALQAWIVRELIQLRIAIAKLPCRVDRQDGKRQCPFLNDCLRTDNQGKVKPKGSV